MVRKQLQSKLGVDLSDRKAFIKEQVGKNIPQARLTAASAELLTILRHQHANNVPACVYSISSM